MRGLHLLADLHDCAVERLLDDPAALRARCLADARACGLRVVGDRFHHFLAADGAPLGVTGVLLLAESHFALHTWPERRAVTADLYVCNFGIDNSARAETLMARWIAAFRPGRHTVRRVWRGEAAAADPA